MKTKTGTFRWRRILYAMGLGASFTGATIAGAQVTFTPITTGDLVEDTGQFFILASGDFDNDGFIDLALTQKENDTTIRPLRLFRNTGDGSFSRITDDVVSIDAIQANGASWADQDNDGDLDLYVTTAVDTSPNIFYRNDGDGTFTKEILGDWVNTPGWSEASAWGDYDNDGFLDLYITKGGPNRLYRNNGDGTMATTNTQTTSTTGNSRGVLWTDYDDDGDLDLFVTGENRVQFRNDGETAVNWEFTWVTTANGGIPHYTASSDIGFFNADYDNDGDLDMIYSQWGEDPMNLLYRNDGETGFVQDTGVIPPAGIIDAVGVSWGDYDNDGHTDLFVCNNLGHNLLYHNNGDGTLTSITESPVVSSSGASAFPVWLDTDHDGDLDLIITNGVFAETPESCEYYRNDGGTNNWIQFDLVGVASNRSAIGAKVRATATIAGEEITQMREVLGSPLRLHFGLGDATVIDTLSIEWPSGDVQIFNDVMPNRIMSIVEGLEWAGHPYEDMIGNVNLCDYLGWISVRYAPWIYCFDLDVWMYLPEDHISDTGAWAFLAK